RPDRPYRLVGDDQRLGLFGAHPGKGRGELIGAVADVVAVLADVERLTHAQDGRDAVPQRGSELRVHRGVVLVVVLPPFGVPDDDVAAAQLREHRAADVTGVGTGVVRRQILRAV